MDKIDEYIEEYIKESFEAVGFKNNFILENKDKLISNAIRYTDNEVKDGLWKGYDYLDRINNDIDDYAEQIKEAKTDEEIESVFNRMHDDVTEMICW